MFKIELKYSVEQQSKQQLEKKLADKEKQLNESSVLLSNFKNEVINQLLTNYIHIYVLFFC